MGDSDVKKDSKPTWSDSLLRVDTREQASFWPEAQRATLTTGDYSVAGYESRVAVERKSVQDLLGSLGGRGGTRRRRFEQAFGRLSQITRGAVVIEGGIAEIYAAKTWGRIKGSHAVGAMISWSARYRVPVYFCSDRTAAKSVTKTYLRLAWEEFQKQDNNMTNAVLGLGPDGLKLEMKP